MTPKKSLNKVVVPVPQQKKDDQPDFEEDYDQPVNNDTGVCNSTGIDFTGTIRLVGFPYKRCQVRVLWR